MLEDWNCYALSSLFWLKPKFRFEVQLFQGRINAKNTYEKEK
jgi:hypothetical protein